MKQKKENIVKLLQQKRNLVDSIQEKIRDNNGNENTIIQQEKQQIKPPDKPAEAISVQQTREVEKVPGQTSDVKEKIRTIHEKLLGKWEIKTHTVHDEDFLSLFIRSRMGDAQFENGIYTSFYEFKGRICLKTLKISGNINNDGSSRPYQYKVRLTFSYRITEEGFLRIIMESGYLYNLVGDQYPVFKELEPDEIPHEMEIKFEDEYLVIIDGSECDYKQLIKTE